MSTVPAAILRLPAAPKRGPHGKLYAKTPLHGPRYRPQRYVIRLRKPSTP